MAHDDSPDPGSTIIRLNDVTDDKNREEAWKSLASKIDRALHAQFHARPFRGFDRSDLLSLVFIKLMNVLKPGSDVRFTNRKAFWSFVRITADRSWIDLWRRSARETATSLQGMASDLDSSSFDVAGTDETPSEVIRYNELHAVVEEMCRRELGEIGARIYLLHLCDNLTYAEIAEIIGWRVDSVRAQFNKDRKRMADLLRHRLDGYADQMPPGDDEAE